MTFSIPASELEVGDLQGFNGEVKTVGHRGDTVHVTYASGRQADFHWEQKLHIHG